MRRTGKNMLRICAIVFLFFMLGQTAARANEDIVGDIKVDTIVSAQEFTFTPSQKWAVCNCVAYRIRAEESGEREYSFYLNKNPMASLLKILVNSDANELGGEDEYVSVIISNQPTFKINAFYPTHSGYVADPEFNQMILTAPEIKSLITVKKDLIK